MRRDVGARWVCAWTLAFGSAWAGNAEAQASAELQATDAGHSGQAVSVPSLDAPGGTAVMLRGFWFGAAGSGVGASTGVDPSDRPGAVLLLHGCGGAYRRASAGDPMRRLDTRFQEVVDLALANGWQALVLDSFTTRGERSICTQRIGARAITQRERRRDALGALAWLAARADVDATRLAVVGWSHGGSTVLATLDGTHPEVQAAAVRPRWAVAHYPGCSASLDRAGDDNPRRWTPTAPLTILIGADDDWTPAEPCRRLVAQVAHAAALREATPSTPPATVQPAADIVVYPGAFHDFDGRNPVRHRADVPNGVRPGGGVTAGRNEAAALDARQRLVGWLQR